MRIVRRPYPFILVISILILTGLLVPFGQSSAATQRTLAWSVVDTPWNGSNGMFIRTCGINDLALGPDNLTFYAVSTDNTSPTTANLFKSTDAGYTWFSNIGNNLAATPGALFPVWNVTVAPDDAKFIIAVTSGAVAPGGPQRLFYSTDAGTTWADTGLALDPTEYISCLDIARYDSADRFRDIAVGTRYSGPPGQGRLDQAL